MRALLLFAALLYVAPAARAAELTVLVRDARGRAVEHAVAWAVPKGSAPPLAKRTAIMDQKNRMFVPHVLPVQTGTAVSFPNSDDIHHQVYSFSRAKTFQLPLYKGTPGNAIVFDKPGIVTLGCNIHDRMSAYIVVVDTPWFAVEDDGRVVLSGLRAGDYDLHVWHPDARAQMPARLVSLRADERATVTIAVGKP